MGSLLSSMSFHAFVVRIDERQLAHGSGYTLAPYLGEQDGAGSRLGAGDVSHGNRRIDARTETARGHQSDRRRRFLILVELAAAADWGSVFRTKSHALAGRALVKLPQNDIGAGKPALARSASATAFLYRPLELRFYRRGVCIEVGTVKAQARFKAQAVAGAEADRRHLRVFQKLSRQKFRSAGGDADLEAVLPRVAGAGDDAIHAEDRQAAHVHEMHCRDTGTAFHQGGLGERSLQGEQGSIIQALNGTAVGKRAAQVRFVSVLAACVDDKEEMIASVRNHQIVEDAAARVGEQCISLASFAEVQKVDRHQGLERTRGAPAVVRADGELPHVRHIEKTRCRTGVEMLLEDAGRKIDRHLVSSERREASAELDVQVMKRGALQSGAGGRLEV